MLRLIFKKQPKVVEPYVQMDYYVSYPIAIKYKEYVNQVLDDTIILLFKDHITDLAYNLSISSCRNMFTITLIAPQIKKEDFKIIQHYLEMVEHE